MKYYRKILVAVNINDDCINTLKKLKGSPYLKQAHIELIHIIKTRIYPETFYPLIYPNDEEIRNLKEKIHGALRKLRDEILTEDEREKSKITVLAEPIPKKYMCEYLEEKKKDLVVLTTKSKKGLGYLTGGFEDYVLRTAPCDAWVLRES